MAQPKLRRPYFDRILSQPTVPFREAHVIRVLTEILDSEKVPYFIDPIGNIVVGVQSEKAYLKRIGTRSQEPARIYIAHMDHPGFHGTEWLSDTRLSVKWHGGTPTRELEGASVWLGSAQGWAGQGTIHSAKLLASGKAIESAEIDLPSAELRAKYPKASDLYGAFRFREPLWQEGDRIYTKAADDLVGAFAIVSLAIDLLGKKKKSAKNEVPFIGLLTRAEEVGFIGAIGHFELGWIKKAKRPLLGVSLETSRALPGAEIGKGPVVRLGDRATVFDSGALKVFSDLAAKNLPDRHQRRIMDGGSCEATAATVYGIPCVGISVPLGNYHNQCFEGGPDSRGELGPAPEFVHLGDVQGLLELCHLLMKPKLPWSEPWAARRKDFRKSLKGYKALLRSGP